MDGGNREISLYYTGLMGVDKASGATSCQKRSAGKDVVGDFLAKRREYLVACACFLLSQYQKNDAFYKLT